MIIFAHTLITMDDFLGVWTLSKIVSAVKNNLEAGLKQAMNTPFSTEQLTYTVIATRNFLLKQQMVQGSLDKFSAFQEINCIKLDCENLSLCCNVPTKDKALHFVLPNYIHLDYIGTIHRHTDFKIYKDESFNYNQYRNKALVNRPYVWLRQHEGNTHGFLINPPTFNIEYLSVTGIFENPLDVNKYGCCSLNPDTDRFPVPPEMVKLIIDELTSNWASWYYRFSKYNANS